uniref:Uncharacterized protein n=1 Tax=Arundo donax TaxID=35708 RepID=A0A0A8ZMG5_ARUDO
MVILWLGDYKSGTQKGMSATSSHYFLAVQSQSENRNAPKETQLL